MSALFHRSLNINSLSTPLRRLLSVSLHIPSRNKTLGIAENMPELHEQNGEDWGEMARIYKQLTVGVSSSSIGAILEKTNAAWPYSKADGILDNGCGPGPIISRIINEYGSVIPKSCSLTAADFSAPMIDQVNNTKKAEVSKDPESLWNRLETSVLNAMDLQGIPGNSKSHVTAGWVYFMTQDPQKCLSESKRILKPDGVLGCSSWKGSQWMDIMNLLPQVRPDKQLPNIPKEWMDVTLLKGEMDKAGFRDVETVEIGVEMVLDDYDAFLDLMTDKMPHMIALLKEFSQDEKKRLREMMLSKVKEFAPSLPGKLHGTALVAIGRK